MHSDCASITGKTHRINQDYARAGITHVPYVIVADGCSSSVDTDFGARLLVKNAENLLRVGFGDGWQLRAIQNAERTARYTSLDVECLDATLLAVMLEEDVPLSNDFHVKVHVFGDGVVVAKYDDGSMAVQSAAFDSGYPQYLSYTLNIERLAKLHKEVGDNPMSLSISLIAPDGGVAHQTPTRVDYGEHGKIIRLPVTDGEKKLECIAVMSDGVHSFTRKNDNGTLESVPFFDVVKRMMSVKVYKGEFMQRQLNGFVKEFTKNGWYNVDDFTIGAIYLGE